MKQSLTLQILLALAVASSGLTIVYNLILRPQSYPVTVRYALPQVQEAPQEPEATPPVSLYAAMDDETDDVEEEPEEPVILVQFPLELNAATMEELLHIPGVGNVTAQRIVQYREVLGGYAALEQLMEIRGIGEGVFSSISPYLYLKEEVAAPETEENPRDSAGEP